MRSSVGPERWLVALAAVLLGVCCVLAGSATAASGATVAEVEASAPAEETGAEAATTPPRTPAPRTPRGSLSRLQQEPLPLPAPPVRIDHPAPPLVVLRC
jgi:hypothetical protein